ncbi:hypothetical protein KXX12_008817, partial [Aspergillus fumigatus]
EAPGALPQRQRRQWVSRDLDRAGRRHQARQCTEQGGFPGAVRSDQRNEMSRRQRERHVLEDGARAAFPHDQIEEERHADDRGKDADLDIRGGRDDAHRDIRRQQQRRAGQRTRQQQPRRI